MKRPFNQPFTHRHVLDKIANVRVATGVRFKVSDDGTLTVYEPRMKEQSRVFQGTNEELISWLEGFGWGWAERDHMRAGRIPR